MYPFLLAQNQTQFVNEEIVNVSMSTDKVSDIYYL